MNERTMYDSWTRENPYQEKKRQDTINFHIEEQGPKFFVTTTTGYKLKRKSHKVSKMQILCE